MGELKTFASESIVSWGNAKTFAKELNVSCKTFPCKRKTKFSLWNANFCKKAQSFLGESKTFVSGCGVSQGIVKCLQVNAKFL